MKPLTLACNVLNSAFKAQSKRVTPDKKTSPLLQTAFNCPAKPRSEFYSLGFAKMSILPPDIAKKKYYIAGYGENNPATGVLDAPQTHAVWIDDLSGLGGILIISLDIVGMLNNDVERLRKRLSDFALLTGCRSINIVSTHNHAGIDTMGIWGPLPFSGKDKKYMDYIFSRCVTAAEKAYACRKKGKLYLGKVEVPDMQEDIRTPIVYSKTLTRLRFVPEDGSRQTYIINFASHSESLQGCNSRVSADFPCYMREKIYRESGAQTLYCVGAIGGMISMDIKNEKEIRENGSDFAASTREIGERLADYALSITESDETVLEPKIGVIRREVYFRAENTVLLLAAKAKILDATEYRFEDGSGFAMKSEISYIKIGSQGFLLLPCEIFPELVYGGFLSAEESGTGYGEEINPPTLASIIGEDTIIIGLANDELGYVLPPNDYLLHPETPYMEIPRDIHGRRHYEETNSLGPETAHSIAATVTEIAQAVEKSKRF